VRGAERHTAHSLEKANTNAPCISCSSAPAPCITRSCFEADGPGPAMISLQHSQRISAPERSAFACRTRAAPPRAAAPSSEGLARKDSAAQLQGLQSGARGGRNQSSTRSREAGSRWCAARGIAAAAAGAARRSTAGRRAGSRTSGLARVAERGRPARGTVAGQAAEHIAHLRKSDSQRVCSVCQPDLCCFEVTVAVDSSCAFALRLLRTVTEGGRDGLL